MTRQMLGPRANNSVAARNVLAYERLQEFHHARDLVELAVAVVIGTQFSNLVKSFVSSFINPLLALFGGKPNFSNLVFTVGKGANKGTFTYGTFLTDVLTFLICALVDCPECTMSIRVAAKRCPECTAQIVPGTEQPQTIS
jgi:large conductance mechanosensitive channel